MPSFHLHRHERRGDKVAAEEHQRGIVLADALENCVEARRAADDAAGVGRALCIEVVDVVKVDNCERFDARRDGR